ncbi:MAG: DedA family protein [Bacteroidales bacterium]|nr:DedA family protein [Bacteroidales bacterium]
MSYAAVGILMTVESSFIPFPSEVVIPPAVYVASNPQSRGGMKVWLIVVIGTLGALLGAYINYFLSRWLGRPIIYKLVDSRLGHLMLLNREKLERAENYFNSHGNISTLIGRLIPVVRQLVSIPAGLAKMNILSFSIFTFIGAAIWNSILALIGHLAYRAADPTVIEKYSHQLSIAILVLFALAILWFTIKLLRKRKKTNTKTT